MAKAKKAEPAAITMPAKGQVVRITNGGRDGYRRGGQKHPKGQKDWPSDTFDEDEMRALIDDPRLGVQVVDAPRGGAAA